MLVERARVGVESRPVLEHRTTSAPLPMEALETSHGGGIEADGTDDPWIGPFRELNKYNQPTGSSVIRCKYCKAEVLTGDKESATHKSQCPAREVSVDG